MENIIDSLQDISHKLLLKLDLDRSVGHQQWIWYRHLYPFNIFLLLLIGIGIAALILAGLLDRARSIVIEGDI